MDLSQRDRLSDLVEELTTSGQPQLNQDKMKEVKKICKVSNDYIDHVYHSVMSQLSQEHAEIRLSAFQIASELFSRSHHFRTLLVDNFQEFLELTVETDTDLPLPPPKEVAKKLRLLALQTVQSWQNSYGSVYKKLVLGYHFLKQVKKVDFQDAEARTVAERRREEDRRRTLERIYKEKVEATVKDMEDCHQEIEATLTELDSCIKLLCPDFDIADLQTTSSSSVFAQSASKSPPDDEQPCCSKDVKDDRIEGKKGAKEVESNSREKKKVQEKSVEMAVEAEVKKRRNRESQKEKRNEDEKREENQTEWEELQREREMEECDEEEECEEEIHGEDFIRNTGLVSHTYTLDLSLSPGLHIKETEENEAVVATVIDLHKLITTKHLPAVQSWIQIFTKSGAEQPLLRRALDLKKSLEAALQKHNELHIDYKTRVRRVVSYTSCYIQTVIRADSDTQHHLTVHQGTAHLFVFPRHVSFIVMQPLIDEPSVTSSHLDWSGLCADQFTPGLFSCKATLLRRMEVSNDYIDHVYHSVMSQLSQEHAEIRLSAFQIASELFSRSHHFRTLLVDNFQTGTQYVDEQKGGGRRTDDGHWERIYKEKVEATVKDMEDCHQEIEATLTELDSCIKLLCPDFDIADLQTTSSSSVFAQSASKSPPDDEQPCCSKDVKDDRIEGKKGAKEVESNSREKKKVQEKSVEMAVEAEVKKRRNRESQKEKRNEDEKREENQTEWEELQREREMEECDEEEECEEEIHGEDFIRNTGLVSHTYTLDLSLSPGLHIKETEENEAVVATVIDLHKLITTKHLPAVQSWIQIFTKSGAEQPLLRRALDLKKSLEAALQKHNELHIDYKTRVRRVMKASSEGEDDDDVDFHEVPEKEGYEPHIPEQLRQEYGLDPAPSTAIARVTSERPTKTIATPPPSTAASSRRLRQQLEEEKDPTCAAATLHLLRQRLLLPTPPSGASSGSSTSASSSQQKAADAPVVPFGLDLYYWGQDQPNAGKIIKAASQHQFWVPHDVEEEVENKDMLAESKSRFISFPGSFTPVSHHCRAPLGGGKLCQRQDRLKCPFHGRVIPRDEEGRPCKEEDRLREEQHQRNREEESDWRDVELMRDIEAATGEDLGSDRVAKKGKRKKKKYPNLSDLKQNANTSRSRLQKKVFSKSAMSRVAQMMDKVDKRKHDKFSNQFNYALK
ncbi:UV-stimulated scaffold protein A [Thalassophryne amazonica]|uniref:UV-stimulated scaffold protein A n=1 Tax=Thalassophryne amazonica TaxID=390379 RepID=UPI001470DF39|nr:UV-stimulated scaffold protein A [Thalassophryne amazonica]